MLKVKPGQPKAAEPAGSTARYVDEANVAGQPVTLRIDDRAPLTVADPRARRLLWQLVEHDETFEAASEGLQQVRQGRTSPLEELDQGLRRKHGIPGLRSSSLPWPRSITHPFHDRRQRGPGGSCPPRRAGRAMVRLE